MEVKKFTETLEGMRNEMEEGIKTSTGLLKQTLTTQSIVIATILKMVSSPAYLDYMHQTYHKEYEF